MGMKRTTIFMDDRDYECVEIIKDVYGVSTASDAIRLALRILVNVQNFQIQAVSEQGTRVIAAPNARNVPPLV